MTNSDMVDSEHITFNSSASIKDLLFDETTMDEYYKRIIRYFMQKYDNKVRLVAEKLNIGKSTIYNILTSDESE